LNFPFLQQKYPHFLAANVARQNDSGCYLFFSISIASMDGCDIMQPEMFGLNPASGGASPGSGVATPALFR
jgi:hypothetical protein